MIFSVNSFTNAFVSEHFEFHRKGWLMYSAGADRPVEICYKFCISLYLAQVLNVATRISDSDAHSPAFLDKTFFSFYVSVRAEVNHGYICFST